MILNAYAVLDAFLDVLRLGLGLWLVVLALAACRLGTRSEIALEERKKLEDRCYLVFVLGGLLLGLNVVSWPLFYLLLQSYVAEWPGVMCIYGVTRIGTGSIGPSRFLPKLVETLQVTKPALVFLSGGWFVLYLVNRATRTAPLTGKVLLLVVAAALLGVGDAAAEGAYLVIPKKEEFLASGCCTEALNEDKQPSGFLADNPEEEDKAVRWLYAGYYSSNILLVLLLGRFAWRDVLPPARWLVPLLLAAALCLVVNTVFLGAAAAPRLLHLRYHRCPYDLVKGAPESLVAVALYLFGCFSVGWACLAVWLGRSGESLDVLPSLVGRLLGLGFVACLCSLVMMSLELILA
jgi:hypothetical protein